MPKLKWKINLTKADEDVKVRAMGYLKDNRQDMLDAMVNVQRAFGKSPRIVYGEYKDE